MLYEFAIVLALIVANAFFAGAEIAVVAVRKTRLQELIESGKRGAQAVQTLRDRPEQFLATVQVGLTVIGATAAAFGGSTIAARLAPVLARIGWLAHAADKVALALVVAVISYLSIVAGELVPKSLALRAGERYALLVSPPLLFLSRIAAPLVRFLTASSNLILRPFGDRTTFTETRFSAEELQRLVDEAAQAGTVHPDAGEIALRALELPLLVASDVMVPRQQVVMISCHATPEEIRRILLEHTHSRLPVFKDNVDNVVGYVAIKDILAVAWEHQLVILDDVMRPVHFVPESKRAVDLLREMRSWHVPFAVVDAHGGTAGIVTLEDLIEELVGEIFSEHEPAEPRMIRKQPDGSVLINGAAPIRDVNRTLDTPLPDDGDWTTVAGLCLALANGIPPPGATLELEDGSRLTIVDASARQVRSVRLFPPALNQQQHAAEHDRA